MYAIRSYYDVKLASDKTAIHDSKWQEGADTEQWPSYEIYPDSPWNYGLVLDKNDLEKSFKIRKKDWPETNFPFNTSDVPISIIAKGKIIPQWTIDQYSYNFV